MTERCAYHYSDDCTGCRLVLPDGGCTLKFCDEHPAGATLSEVGEVFGLSRERVRQIEVVAIARFEALLPLVEAGRVLPEGTEIPAGSRSHRRLAGAARSRLQHNLSLHGQPRQRGDERRDMSQPTPDPRRVTSQPQPTTPHACSVTPSARMAQCRDLSITIDAVSRQPGASYPCAQAVRIPAMAHRKRETGGYGSDFTPSKAALRSISVKNGTEITAETPMNRERSR